ncbi:hypothetical protein ACNQ1X_02265 [Mycoplasma sp. SK341A]|uniref:hypothetical protein n=1 Tax=Mycoplasma sp. SK341A TaxID=3401679 RepID=UPI003AAFB490
MDKSIFKLLQRDEIVVHGSYALKLLNLLNREAADIDILIYNNGDIIEKNIIVDSIINSSIVFLDKRDEFYTKFTINNKKIEIMQYKNIDNSMITLVDNIKVLKPKWILAFKVCQLFTSWILFLQQRQTRSKTIQTINDLNFLINKIDINNDEMLHNVIEAIKYNLDFEIFIYYMSPYSELTNFKIFFGDVISNMSPKLISILLYISSHKIYNDFISKINIIYKIFHTYAIKFFDAEDNEKANEKNSLFNFGNYFIYFDDIQACIQDILWLNNQFNDDTSYALKKINQNWSIDFSAIEKYYISNVKKQSKESNDCTNTKNVSTSSERKTNYW